jgi:hypothetical protein
MPELPPDSPTESVESGGGEFLREEDQIPGFEGGEINRPVVIERIRFLAYVPVAGGQRPHHVLIVFLREGIIDRS